MLSLRPFGRRPVLRRNALRHSQIESLEIRIVPAVTVKSGNTLKAVGDDAADAFDVIDQGNGQVLIRGRNGTQVILDGELIVQRVIDAPRKVQITMQGGDVDLAGLDLASLKYVSNGAGDLFTNECNINSVKATSNFGNHDVLIQDSILGKVRIATRGGAGEDDVFLLANRINGPLTIDMAGGGNGDDLTIARLGGDVDNQIDGRVNLTFSGGADKDLTIADTAFASDVLVNSSAPDLQVFVQANSQFQRLEINNAGDQDLVSFFGLPAEPIEIEELHIATGGGNVKVDFRDTIVNGPTRILMGNSAGFLEIDDSTFAGEFEVEATGAAANIDIEQNVAANVTTVFEQKAEFRLGAGTQVHLSLNAAASATTFQSDALFIADNPNANLTVAVARVTFAVDPVLENVIRIDA